MTAASWLEDVSMPHMIADPGTRHGYVHDLLAGDGTAVIR
jgi:hypothetical protein